MEGELSGGELGFDLGGGGYALTACASRSLMAFLSPSSSNNFPTSTPTSTLAYMTLHNTKRKSKIYSNIVQHYMISMM